MAAELLDWGWRTSLALAVAIVVVLALRAPVRRLLGAGAVLWLWLLLPAAIVATSVPRPAAPAAMASSTRLPVPVSVVSAPTAPGGGEVGRVAAEPAPVAVVVSSDSASTAPASSRWSFAGLFAIAVVGARASVWLPWAWLAGTLALAAVFVGQQRRFHRRLGPLTARADGSWSAAGDRIGPAIVGVLRPRIVVPNDFAVRYDRDQQRLVLAHEMVHLRRGDLQVNLGLCALRCLFWFHPLVHLAAARLRVDQELACDAAVLRRHPDSGRSYASALLNTQLADLGLPVGCYWQSSQPLKWRITMLKQPLPGRTRLVLGVAFALLASSATAATLWQAQPSSAPASPATVLVAAAQVAPTPLVAPAPPTAPEPLVAPTAITATMPVTATTPVTAPTPVVAPSPATPATPHPERTPPAPSAPPVDASPAGATPAPDAISGALVSADIAVGDADFVPPVVIDSRPASLSRSMQMRPNATEIPPVVVQVDVDAQGRPSNPVYVSGEVGRFHRATALRAVKRWRFEPARRGGVAVAASVTVPVHFAQPATRYEEFWRDAMRHPRPSPAPVQPLAALGNGH